MTEQTAVSQDDVLWLAGVDPDDHTLLHCEMNDDGELDVEYMTDNPSITDEDAIEHFKTHGTIPIGHADAIAGYLSRKR